MIETTSPEDRKNSTRRLWLSDGFTEYEIAVTLRQDRALPDEPVDLVITGELPQNGPLADALVDVAAALNRHRALLSLSAAGPAAPRALCHEG